jgi:hypothetical protein
MCVKGRRVIVEQLVSPGQACPVSGLMTVEHIVRESGPCATLFPCPSCSAQWFNSHVYSDTEQVGSSGNVSNLAFWRSLVRITARAFTIQAEILFADFFRIFSWNCTLNLVTATSFPFFMINYHQAI